MQLAVAWEGWHMRPDRSWSLRLSEAVTKRRSGWACIGNPNLEQETTEGVAVVKTAYRLLPIWPPA